MSLLAVYQELQADWVGREPAASSLGGTLLVKQAAWSEWAAEGDAFGLGLSYPVWASAVTGDLVKVGPKGYIHGWIKVGPGVVGDLVHHPEHGHGKVTRRGSKTVGVQFDSGAYHAFEHGGAGESHFVERAGGAVAKPAARPKREPLPGLRMATLKHGDRVVWEPPGEEPVHGTVRLEGPRRNFIDWHGGRTEPISRSGREPHMRMATHEEQTPAAAPLGMPGNADLARRVATGVDESSAVKPRHGVSADVRRVQLGDGSTAYRKVAYPGETVNDEYLATRVAQAVGVPVPAVHRVDDRTLFLADVQGQHGKDAGLSHEDSLNHPDARLIGLADALTGVQDRSTHGVNHLVTPEGRIVAIDNAPNPVFGENGTRLEQPYDHAGVALPVQDMRGANPFAGRFVDAGPDSRGSRAKVGSELRTGDTSTVGEFRNLIQGTDLRGFEDSRVDTWRQGNDLTPAEAAAIRQRLEALRPEFDAVGRGDRLDYIKDRLNAIEAAAGAGAGVPVEDLKRGDHATVVGTDQYGAPISLTGFVDTPTPVKVGRRGGKKKDMIAVSVTENQGGANGWRGAVYVDPGTHVTPTPAGHVPALTGHVARDTQIRSGWKTGDRLIHNTRGPVIYGEPDEMDWTGRAGGGGAQHVEFEDDGNGGMVSADRLSGYVPSPADLEQRARDRQATIDQAHAVSTVVADVHEMVGNETSPDVIRRSLAAAGRRLGVDTTGLQNVAHDPAALVTTADAMGTRARLTRVGDVGGPVLYNRSLHTPMGPGLREGQPVMVVRPGHTVDMPGEGTVRLDRAVVEEATPEEVAVPAPSPRVQADALRREATARQRALDASLPAAGAGSRRHHTPAGPVGAGQGDTAGGWQHRAERQAQIDALYARADEVAATPRTGPTDAERRAAEDLVLARDRPGAPQRIRERAAEIRAQRAAEATPAELPAAAELRAMFPTDTGEMLGSGYYDSQITSAMDNPGYTPRSTQMRRLVDQVGEPEARRIAWEADAEHAIGRHVVMQRPEDPNEDPYADLPPVTSAEMAQGKADTERKLKARFAGKKIVVRLRANNVEDILRDGRMKNAFETGRSGGDSKGDAGYRRRRANIEQILFGIPTDADPSKRPIYAHLADTVGPVNMDDGEPLQSYGDVQVVLKDTVRPRTTASVGDSIDDKVMPSPVDDPKWYSTNHTFGRYDEAQVHGGVSVGDIEEVVFPSPPGEGLRRQLAEAGIPWRSTSEPESDTIPVMTSTTADRTPAIARHEIILPDGTIATRGSKTNAYTHAVMVTQDNRRHAANLQKEADDLRAASAIFEQAHKSGDYSGLKLVHTSSNGYGEKFYSSEVPGYPEIRFPDHRLSAHQPHDYEIRDGLTTPEAVRDHWAMRNIEENRKLADRREAEAAALREGPEKSYSIVRWSKTHRNAAAALSNTYLAPQGGAHRSRVVEVGTDLRQADPEPAVRIVNPASAEPEPTPAVAKPETVRMSARRMADNPAAYVGAHLTNSSLGSVTVSSVEHDRGWVWVTDTAGKRHQLSPYSRVTITPAAQSEPAAAVPAARVVGVQRASNLAGPPTRPVQAAVPAPAAPSGVRYQVVRVDSRGNTTKVLGHADTQAEAETLRQQHIAAERGKPANQRRTERLLPVGDPGSYIKYEEVPRTPTPAGSSKPGPVELAQAALTRIKATADKATHERELRALPVAALRELAKLHGIVGMIGGREALKGKKPDLIRGMMPWLS